MSNDESFVMINGMTGEMEEIEGDPFDWMRRNEEAANTKVTDAQRMMGTEGHRFWIRLDQPFLIAGEAWTMDEMVASEMKYWSEEDGPREDYEAYLRSHQEDTWQRGYRFGRAYSEVEPTGELGSTHVVEMTEVSEQEFEALRTAGWDMRDALVENAEIIQPLITRLLKAEVR